MSTRVRKLLALVFLIAVPLVTSVANPIPAPSPSPVNATGYGSDNPNPPALQDSSTPILHHSRRADSRTACPTKPMLHVANRSKSASQARRAPQPDVGEVGRTTTRTACPTKLYFYRLAALSVSEVGRTTPLIRPVVRVYQQSPTTTETDLNDSYDVFYEQLSADGHWIYAENYGYVFQPKVAENNADWRPYTNGHWEATDRGWYWDTEEPFGWATYHYGRWASIDGTGWVWAPGTDWSPAWVSWRICDNGFIGWAPLSPECPRPSEAVAIGSWCDSYSDTGPGAFCFLPISAWFNPSYVGALAPISQNLELINASRNVTNISVTKTIISDFGPRPEVIAQETGKEVETYLLHYSEVRGQHNFARSIAGNALNISGPAAKLKASAVKVPTVIKTIVRPTVNRGWNGLTKEDIDRVHVKYAAEAHIPSHLPTKPIERVNLVPSSTPAVIRPVSNQKEKEPKESKETAKASGKKGGKGKTANTSAHKGSQKHKTASESKEEGGAKGEGKSKGGSKLAKASKDTEDTQTDESESPKKKAAKASKNSDGSDESERPKKKSTSSKSSSSESKSTKTAKGSGGSKSDGSSGEKSKETKKSSKEKED